MEHQITDAVRLDAIAGRFSTFFIDQFGVLHDGVKPYDGAVEALAWLHAQGKKIVLLSNSGKRSELNAIRLEQFGFERSSFDAIVTSGEVAWHLLKDEIEQGSLKPGSLCLLLTRDEERSAIDGLALQETNDSLEADFILLTGSCGDRMEMADYMMRLAPAARRGIPCICTNPDKIMLTGKGPKFGAGAIADRYAELGGPVRWIGKPYPEMYRFALRMADTPAAGDVCCIGDSIEHDIAGGVGMGMATALVRTGILQSMGAGRLQSLFRQHGATPDIILSTFSVGKAEGA